jgi:hypothetical protein
MLRNVSIALTLQGNDGAPYMKTTGFDDNHDGLLNDRPAGTELWALRGTPQFTMSTRIGYTLTRGAPTTPQPSGVPYRVVMFVRSAAARVSGLQRSAQAHAGKVPSASN